MYLDLIVSIAAFRAGERHDENLLKVRNVRYAVNGFSHPVAVGAGLEGGKKKRRSV